MARVRSKNTKPELLVRRVFTDLGARYRLHASGLPGKPDLVIRSRRIAVFVHGCFWHRHSAATCKLSRLPKSRLAFWVPKLTANHDRDKRNQRALRALGWRVLVIWECQLSRLDSVRKRVERFLTD